MKFEELFKPKPGSLAAEMQKTIDGLNQEIKELRAHAERVGEANDRLVVENAALRKELDWKTERLRLLSKCLHNIDGLFGEAVTSVFVDALDAARKETKP